MGIKHECGAVSRKQTQVCVEKTARCVENMVDRANTAEKHGRSMAEPEAGPGDTEVDPDVTQLNPG